MGVHTKSKTWYIFCHCLNYLSKGSVNKIGAFRKQKENLHPGTFPTPPMMKWTRMLLELVISIVHVLRFDMMRTIKLKCGNKPYRCKRGKGLLRVPKKLCIATVLNPAINNEAKSFISRKERCKKVLQTRHQRNNSERLKDSRTPKSSQNRLARPTSHNKIQQWQCELNATRGHYLGNDEQIITCYQTIHGVGWWPNNSNQGRKPLKQLGGVACKHWAD